MQNRDIGVDNDQNLDVPNGNTDQNGSNDTDPTLDDQNTSHTGKYNTDDTKNTKAMFHVNLEQNDVNMLQVIVEKLIEGSSANKWKKRNLTPGKLYQEYLSTAESINNSLTVQELLCISDIYTQYTKGKMKAKKSDRKAVIVKEISKYFGDKSSLTVTRKMAKDPSTLGLSGKQFIMKLAYPKDVLVAAVAKCHHIENTGELKWKSSIPVIQRYEDTAKDHTIYCYPEYNQE